MKITQTVYTVQISSLCIILTDRIAHDHIIFNEKLMGQRKKITEGNAGSIGKNHG